MGVHWWWGGSSTCLLSTWQEQGSEDLSQQLCSPTFPLCHSQPPALLWEGAGVHPGQTLSLWDTAFLPHLQGTLHGEVGQQDLPGPSAQLVLHGLGSQSCGGQMEQRKIRVPHPPWHGQ